MYNWERTGRPRQLCFAQPLPSKELRLCLRPIPWSGIERRGAEAVNKFIQSFSRRGTTFILTILIIVTLQPLGTLEEILLGTA